MKVVVRIQELVDARGWDLQELARQVNLDSETVRNLYEGHLAELELAELGRLSQVLEVLPNEIVAAVEEKQPSAAAAPAPRDPHVPTAAESGRSVTDEAGEGKLDKLDVQEPINVAGQQMGHFPHSADEPGIQVPHVGSDGSSSDPEGPPISSGDNDKDRA